MLSCWATAIVRRVLKPAFRQRKAAMKVNLDTLCVRRGGVSKFFGGLEICW